MNLTFDDVRDWLKKELNFFRIHLLCFIFVPLISAAIFYAANGQFHISFVDALFLCYSAVTVTGLATVNLSTLTVLQQAILFLLMAVGNVTVVAWVMVLIRKQYFVEYLEGIKKRERAQYTIRSRITRWLNPLGSNNLKQNVEIHVKQPTAIEALPEQPRTNRFDPSEGIGAALVGGGSAGIGLGIALRASSQDHDASRPITETLNGLHPSDSGHLALEPPQSATASFEIVDTDDCREGIIADTHSFTSSPRSAALQLPTSPAARSEGQLPFSPKSALPATMKQRRGLPIPRRQTVIQPPPTVSADGRRVLGQRGKDQGLGGFPGPFQLLRKIARNHFPRLFRAIERIFTENNGRWKNEKRFTWLSGEFHKLVIYRNSDFDTEGLDDEELERLGGLEYRALDFLSWLVIAYFIGVQLISIVLIAPWLSMTHTYDGVFEAQPRRVNKSCTIMAQSQVIGSYTGGGMSLVDAGMVPFQQAYWMIFSMIFSILAGNHGLVSKDSFHKSSWICTKFVKDDSPEDRILHFLLDHPRRCFIYLFPSHVTWFLVAVLIFFTTIEWISFIVLDIGLSVTESLPAGTRAVAGLFQSFAVRASGFAIVSLSSLAPAFQFLCVIMMYIAVYPVAMSIRSTNVYEERSLGVFKAPAADEDEEPNLREDISRRQRIFQYFGWHLRRQVAYDIWWLVSGIFIICIIERTIIMDDVNAPWFNLFRILFELVSAFGGIGLSLGIPTENYSFSGAFSPLSKLVVIAIMVRGRHRGLPVAIDRAILLPQDLVPTKREEEPPVASAATYTHGDPLSTVSDLHRPATKELPEHLDVKDMEKGQ
ncbi:cation transport protein-domain-containing protein [Cytidiella melzeri]|nr:cation transport protein-domain-containing protein [Cytidiella melzeri]